MMDGVVKSSLRVQLSIGAAVITAMMVAISGVLVALSIDHQDRSDLDTSMAQRIDRLMDDVGKMIAATDSGHGASTNDTYGDLLTGADSSVRLIVGARILVERGQLTADSAPTPSLDGYTTVDVEGVSWRSLTRSAPTPPKQAELGSTPIKVQVLQSLAPLEQRRKRNLWIVMAISLAAAAVAALVGWLLATMLLRPLLGLRAAAVDLGVERDHELLPVPRGPNEVTDLSETLNSMLARLHTSTRATQRFTADAGHELRSPMTSLGAYIEILRRRTSDGETLHVVNQMFHEHQRMVALLSGLQELARGDAEVLPARTEVDLTDLVVRIVETVRSAHPQINIDISTPLPDIVIDGWSEGLGLVLRNLLENAARHGKSDGRISCTITRQESTAVIEIDDDGPGIPVNERARVWERFSRGERVQNEGSGLGLALVAQQVRLHGGTVALESSVLGGLKVIVVLPLAES